MRYNDYYDYNNNSNNRECYNTDKTVGNNRPGVTLMNKTKTKT